MTNQKELTVRQIRTMLKEAEVLTGEPTPTTKEVLLLLENEKAKNLLYNLFELNTERKKLQKKKKQRLIC